MRCEIEEYTESEKQLLREQLRRGVAMAKEAAARRDIKLHPRIAEFRAAAKAALNAL
jgi:hypothetical protein